MRTNLVATAIAAGFLLGATGLASAQTGLGGQGYIFPSASSVEGAFPSHNKFYDTFARQALARSVTRPAAGAVHPFSTGEQPWSSSLDPGMQ